ncbi:MAG: NAD-dependent epimerase [Spirochaetaceae bacterium]|nr:MAG: NAD-dependent epimerase [Spirochaetaceae bacterium]
MKVLVTGTAGFIGYHLTRRLLDDGFSVVGLDSVNDYYDVRVKHGRLVELGIVLPEASESVPVSPVSSTTYPDLMFIRMELENLGALKELFAREKFDVVVNLAAQAGVRYSLTNPEVYVSANVQGFLNVLEAVRACIPEVKHLVYASSSSVYGIDRDMPFRESAAADHPASLYASSKRANELMAHTYSHLFRIPTTGLRFFTVYGPWGRPDMALFLFTRAILEGNPIDVFNYGEMERDFTYVDDIVEGIVRVMQRIPDEGADGSERPTPVPARVYNIGNGAPVRLMDFIHALEAELGIEARKNMLPMQPGDVPATWADCSALERDTGYRPGTEIRRGIREFVRWYREFYKLG